MRCQGKKKLIIHIFNLTLKNFYFYTPNQMGILPEGRMQKKGTVEDNHLKKAHLAN